MRAPSTSTFVASDGGPPPPDAAGRQELAAKIGVALAGPLTAASARLLGLPAVREALAAAVDVLAGRSVILRLDPDLAGPHRAAVEVFLRNLAHIDPALESARQEAAIAKLADIVLPDPLAAARGPLAADNLELRDRFVAQTAPLTSVDVGALAGHRGRNPYATAARWKKAGEIFSVQHRGTEYFPAFQFRDGRPHPTIRPALAALPAAMSPWQRAFWFVSTNGWLDGKAPADMLDDPESVILAARREGQEVVG